MNKVKEALTQSKKCLYCGGYLEPKYGELHPYCKTLKEGGIK